MSPSQYNFLRFLRRNLDCSVSLGSVDVQVRLCLRSVYISFHEAGRGWHHYSTKEELSVAGRNSKCDIFYVFLNCLASRVGSQSVRRMGSKSPRHEHGCLPNSTCSSIAAQQQSHQCGQLGRPTSFATSRLSLPIRTQSRSRQPPPQKVKMPNLSNLVSCVLLLWAATPAIALVDHPPAEPAVLHKPTSQGCYSSLGNLEGVESRSRDGTAMANSPAWCTHRCRKEKRPVFALHRGTCFCMDTYPPRAFLVADSECDFPCPGAPYSACGGKDAYGVFNLGMKIDIEHQEWQDGSGASDGNAAAEDDTSALPEKGKEEL